MDIKRYVLHGGSAARRAAGTKLTQRTSSGAGDDGSSIQIKYDYIYIFFKVV